MRDGKLPLSRCIGRAARVTARSRKAPQTAALDLGMSWAR
jgi:hypothetical protein